jgi:hypothetical protein
MKGGVGWHVDSIKEKRNEQFLSGNLNKGI